VHEHKRSLCIRVSIHAFHVEGRRTRRRSPFSFPVENEARYTRIQENMAVLEPRRLVGNIRDSILWNIILLES
jgi:hypothetical protein